MPTVTLNATAIRIRLSSSGGSSDESSPTAFAAGDGGYYYNSRTTLLEFTLPSDFAGGTITTATFASGSVGYSTSYGEALRCVIGVPDNAVAFASQDPVACAIGTSKRYIANSTYSTYSGNTVDAVCGGSFSLNVKAMLDEAIAAGRTSGGTVQILIRKNDMPQGYGGESYFSGTTPTLYLDYTSSPLSVSIASGTLRVGGTKTCTVTRTTSTAADLVVTLSSSSTAALTVPSTVTILAGATTATFAATAIAVGTSTITATAGGNSGTVSVSVLAALPVGLGDEARWWCPSLDSAGNGTTTLTDLTGGGIDGTLTNMDPPTDWPADTGSGGVRALDFDGSNDRIAFASPISPSGARSIAMWVKFTSPSSRQGLIGTRPPAASQGWVFLLNASNTLRYFHTGGGDLSATTTINSGTWYHLVATFSGSTAKLYKDGSLIATSTSFANDTATTFNGVLGCEDEGNSGPFTGRIDDARIYTRAITATEVTHLSTSRGILGAPSAGANGTVALSVAEVALAATSVVSTAASTSNTLADITASAQAVVSDGASTSNTLADVTANAQAVVSDGASVDAVIDDVASFSAAVNPVNGAVAMTLTDVSSVSDSVITVTTQADLSQSIDGVTVSFTAACAVNAEVAVTLDSCTAGAAGITASRHRMRRLFPCNLFLDSQFTHV